MLEPNSIHKSALEVFHSMEEGVKYELLPEAQESYNKIKKKYGHTEFNKIFFLREDAKLRIKLYAKEANDIIINTKEWTDDFSLAFSLALTLAFSLAFSLAFALAFAFTTNQIRKVDKGLDNKIAEIEGKKYKLLLQE